MTEPNQGAQRAAFDRAIEQAAIQWVKRTELRKWAIMQASDLLKEWKLDRNIKFTDPVTLAKEIYDFVRTE